MRLHGVVLNYLSSDTALPYLYHLYRPLDTSITYKQVVVQFGNALLFITSTDVQFHCLKFATQNISFLP
jgi:hypothetical protein